MSYPDPSRQNGAEPGWGAPSPSGWGEAPAPGGYGQQGPPASGQQPGQGADQPGAHGTPGHGQQPGQGHGGYGGRPTPSGPGAAPSGWGAQPAPGGYGQQGPGHGQQGPGHGQQGPPTHGQQGPPTYGQQQPPSYGQQPGSYGQYGAQGGGMPPAWGPAPQPGIIPLRPLTLGEIYDGAIRSIRTNPAVMFVLSAVLVALATVVQGIATWGFFEELNTLVGMDPATLEAMDPSSLLATLQSALLGYTISGLVSFLITTILNGLLIHAVSQAVIGRKMSLEEVWSATKGQIPRLLALSLVVSLLLVLVAGLCVGLIALLILTENAVVIGLGVLFLVVVMLVAMLAVITLTVLATPALVLERAKVFTALRRSFLLTKQTFWRVLGIYLLTAILVGILGSIISYPVAMFGQFLGGMTVSYLLTLVANVISLAVTTPFMAAVTALLYIDVRMRLEALDVELARAAQEA